MATFRTCDNGDTRVRLTSRESARWLASDAYRAEIRRRACVRASLINVIAYCDVFDGHGDKLDAWTMRATEPTVPR
jgi:trans-aconitate methyltransferase